MIEMRQAENKVRIEGVLSEIDLDYGSYVKDSKTVETIRGSINVLVEQIIGGKTVTNEIPVFLFANKFTNKGTKNPAYESIEKIKKEYISIAAAGGADNADRVRITSGQIRMNEFFNNNGQLVSYPRVNASFVSKIKKEDCKPEATFVVEMVVANQGYKLDKDGVETKDYEVKGVIPGWAGAVDVVDFVCANENVASSVSQYWQNGDTVRASGRLNFTSTTEEYTETQGFGDPIVRTRTINVSELIITGGNPEPLEGDAAFSSEQINAALAARKNRLDEQKVRDAQRAKARMAPAPANTTSNGPLDLGF